MASHINPLNIAQQVFDEQVAELKKVRNWLGEEFNQAIDLIYHSKGTVVLVGIGKSAHIAKKIEATLNSTGTKAQFLHAAEAIHGDLGLLQQQDVVIVLSKSGNTQELKNILGFLKQRSHAIIAITGNTKSELAKQANVVLNTTVSKESDPNNLAPTASTTAQLVMGDCLSVALIKKRNFTAQHFAQYHPGGALGKQLLWTVEQVYNPEQTPKVSPDDAMPKVIESLSYSKNGITVLIGNEHQIVGVITDGDLRRMLVKYKDFSHLKAKDIATLNPKTITLNTMAKDAFNMMTKHKIGQLVVVNSNQRYVGVLDIHDLIKEGIS